jgi:hypothetical protein
MSRPMIAVPLVILAAPVFGQAVEPVAIDVLAHADSMRCQIERHEAPLAVCR